MKPVVIGILYRKTGNGLREIMTQLRLVQNKSYDSLYNGTWEAIGETVETGESVIDALLRGITEECGIPGFRPVVILGTKLENLWFEQRTTGKGDRILACDPFCFVQQMGPPQPWFGPVFLVEVTQSFEPNIATNDGEAGEHMWWNPADLISAIEHEPTHFMGLHMPALDRAAKFLSL